MTLEQNRQIVKLQFDLLNAGDVKGAAALWADESYNHGRKVDQRMMESIYASLRSVQEKHILHEMVAEGEWVTVRTTCEGLHVAKPLFPVNSGIFERLEPTGRKYTNQHIHLFRVVDGKLKEHWANRDDLGVATQIGLELRPGNT